MDVVQPTSITSQDWYTELVEDCKDIVTEHVFTSRWTLIEGYHLLGKRISEDNNNFERSKIYGEKITSRLSQSLNVSKRTIERSMQFAKKYPDLTLLPVGKNISWTQICNKFLPVHSEEVCQHEDIIKICKKCKKIME